MLDFFFGGQAHGDVACTLLANDMDTDALRPFIGNDGRHYRTVLNPRTKKKEAVCVGNSSAVLRKDEWIRLDEILIKAARPRFKIVADVLGAGLTYPIPDGMATTVLQHQRMTDMTGASVAMDGMAESEQDRPTFDLSSLPLPIIFKDVSFPLRQILTSRRMGQSIDMTGIEQAGVVIAEESENFLIGNRNAYAYGGGTIYGIINFPDRLLKTIADPNGMSWTPADTFQDVLSMKTKSQDAFHYGPWNCYCSTDWDEFMDDDYSAAKGDLTLRQRIGKITGVSEPMTLDYLPDATLMLVQMTSNVVQEVVAMPLRTLQWDSHGGLKVNFKVMTIMVPRVRADINSNTGIVHGSY